MIEHRTMWCSQHVQDTTKNTNHLSCSFSIVAIVTNPRGASLAVAQRQTLVTVKLDSLKV